MKTGVVIAMLLVATPALAQPQPSTPPGGQRSDGGASPTRYQIQVMERVLEQAVQQSAQVIGRRMQGFTPAAMLFAGPARARGFWLEGYGVFFDVEVPAMRRSITWTFRTLSQQGLAVSSALEALRQHVQSLGDQRARDDLEQALRSLEVQVGPAPPVWGGRPRPSLTGAASGAGSTGGRVTPEPPPDPGEAYAAEIRRELIDAMLDYSGSLRIGPDEWLTVAASDPHGRVAAGDPAGGTTTMLRIRGRDLAAFRSQEIDRQQALIRVNVREF